MNESLNRIWKYQKKHEEKIFEAVSGDGYYYILKMLYKALNNNLKAANTTRTIENNLQAKEIRKQQDFMEVSCSFIVDAIEELIDADYERRISDLEEESYKNYHDAEFWQDMYHDRDD